MCWWLQACKPQILWDIHAGLPNFTVQEPKGRREGDLAFPFMSDGEFDVQTSHFLREEDKKNRVSLATGIKGLILDNTYLMQSVFLQVSQTRQMFIHGVINFQYCFMCLLVRPAGNLGETNPAERTRVLAMCLD